MASTFDVFYLGTGPSIDPTEGNNASEDAGALVGTTYGSVADPLVDHIHSLAPGTAGYSGGNTAGYDVNNSLTNDQFAIDGGSDQTVDGAAIYNATITYTDGTTASITATVIQDSSGNLYLMPEVSNNTDQAALEAQPIRSVTLDSVSTVMSQVFGDRYDANYAVCFTSGTAICTPGGDVLIDDLRVGDLVCTMDNGPQPIRWIGRRQLDRTALSIRPNLRPILIAKGVLGSRRNLLVSPLHGMLLGRDHLVRAKHLIHAPRCPVRVANGIHRVTYIHLMFDAHQVIWAENAPCESFYPGPMALRGVDRAAYAELSTLFPGVSAAWLDTGTIRDRYGGTARTFLARHAVPLQCSRIAAAMA